MTPIQQKFYDYFRKLITDRRYSKDILCLDAYRFLCSKYRGIDTPEALYIIRKTKCSCLLKRSVPFGKTKRTSKPHFSKKFRPGFAGCLKASRLNFKRPSNIVRRPFFSLFRFTLWVASRPLYRLRYLA